MLLVHRHLRLPWAATRGAYPGAPPGRTPPETTLEASRLETSPLQTLQAPAFGGPLSHARRALRWSLEANQRSAHRRTIAAHNCLSQSLPLPGRGPSPPGHPAGVRQSPLRVAPRSHFPEHSLSNQEGTSVPARTFRRGPGGSRARAGLFWLPLGAPPGSSRFGRSRGAEIPRPMQAGGICGKLEARLGCLPDPVHTAGETDRWGRPTPPHISSGP